MIYTHVLNRGGLYLALVLDALAPRRPAPGLVHHSDRGSPYASGAYCACLAAHGMVGSMSRVGDCWDNAVTESFVATFKAECLEGSTWRTREEARPLARRPRG